MSNTTTSSRDLWLSVRVSAEEHEALKRLAAEEDRSVSAEVRRALKKHLEGKA